MTFREKAVVRILLLVAWILATGIDRTLSDEVKALATHINVHALSTTDEPS